MGWYMRRFTEEDNKRFSEFMDKFYKDHPIKLKKVSDFDHSDEAKERDQSDMDAYIHESYESMMSPED